MMSLLQGIQNQEREKIIYNSRKGKPMNEK
jgi:hypothetical protein